MRPLLKSPVWLRESIVYWTLLSAPSILRFRSRPGRDCSGLKQEGHFLSVCTYCDRFKRRFQYFSNISDVAAYFLADGDRELDDFTHKFLAYFAYARAQIFHAHDQHEEAEEALDVWIADMFAVLDKSGLWSSEAPL